MSKATESRRQSLAPHQSSSVGRTYPRSAKLGSLSRYSVVSSFLLTDEQQQIVNASSHEHETRHFEFDIGDRQQPAAAEDAPSDATAPSPRCANREEWQGPCRLWSGKAHNRYILFKHWRQRGGLGTTLMRISWLLDRAISFDLEPVFVGPLRTAHDAADIGDWMGLTNNPLLSIQDPEGFERATRLNVPCPEGDGDAWFRQQENRTSVAYEADAMNVQMMRNWGKPVSAPSSDPRLCRYVRQALRDIYWTAPQTRGRCHAFIAEDLRPVEAVVPGATGYRSGRTRPWVIAVHVRRGDIIHFRHGFRNIPHKYFSAAVNSILWGIAVTDPAAHVSVLVFSEGPDTLDGLQLQDEHEKTLTWDIEHDSCLDIGLNCSQVRGMTPMSG